MHPQGLHRALHSLWFTPVRTALTRSLGARPGEFLDTSVERLPLPDASVDAAVASVTAYHWTNQVAGFAELARVLRPGGRS